MNEIRWYTHYNNPDPNISDVLTKDIENKYMLKTDLVVAKKTSAVKNIFKYAKIRGIDAFDKLFKKTEEKSRRYYAVLRSNYRYLYFDIDYKWDAHLNDNEKSDLLKQSMNLLNYSKLNLKYKIFQKNNGLYGMHLENRSFLYILTIME